MKNQNAVELGKLSAGISKEFSEEEINLRRKRLCAARKLRWKKDLNGKIYGRLTVLSLISTMVPKGRLWLCKCSCGNKCEKYTRGLTESSSCGCLVKENIRRAHKLAVMATTKFSHPLKSKIKNTYRNMMKRCHDSRDKRFKDYGGRGISVCTEWKKDRYAFYSWAVAAGIANGFSIDRINNDGNYSPENCQWIPMAENTNKSRRSRYLTWKGETKTVSSWSRKMGVCRQAIQHRVDRKWSLERIFTQPYRPRL